VIFIFTDAAVVIELGSASPSVRVPDSGPEGIHAEEPLPTDDLASARYQLVEAKTGPSHKIAMCDVALVSRRTGAVDRDAVCSLLTECLQDVGSVLLTLYFSCLLLNF
jgi:hypothetical protein